MKYQSGLPWYKIQDYIVELESQSNVRDLFTVALERLYELVPYDVTSNIFSQKGDTCIFDINNLKGREILNIDYNNYYASINPVSKLDLYSFKWCDWRDFQNTEFVTDFMYPQGIRYSLSYVSPLYPFTISIQRSRRSSVFKDRDYEILTFITPHLTNIYSFLNKISTLESGYRQAAELTRGSKLLSKREAEVAVLLCQRLTMAEIATKMMISPRTVETYVENIREKLGVRNRRELLAKLLKSE